MHTRWRPMVAAVLGLAMGAPGWAPSLGQEPASPTPSDSLQRTYDVARTALVQTSEPSMTPRWFNGGVFMSHSSLRGSRHHVGFAVGRDLVAVIMPQPEDEVTLRLVDDARGDGGERGDGGNTINGRLRLFDQVTGVAILQTDRDDLSAIEWSNSQPTIGQTLQVVSPWDEATCIMQPVTVISNRSIWPIRTTMGSTRVDTPIQTTLLGGGADELAVGALVMDADAKCVGMAIQVSVGVQTRSGSMSDKALAVGPSPAPATGG